VAEYEIINLPKETVSDDRYKILSVSVATGSKVAANEVLLEFQTSKATMELVSPAAGYFHTWIEAGQDLPVGAPLGLISQSAKAPNEAMDKLRAESAPDAVGAEMGDVRFSKAAQDLVTQHRLSPGLFAGMKLVKREDVERVLSEQASGGSKSKPSARLAVKADPSSVIVIGGGGHAKICIDILRTMGTFKIAGIVDGNLPVGSEVLGIPVIGTDADLQQFHADGVQLAVCGVGATANHPSRTALYEKIRKIGFRVPNLIHPAAVIEPSAHIGEGNQVMAGALVGSDAVVGNNCIINAGAIVSHESKLSDNVHIAPGAVLGGNVTVGRDTLIGMGATIYLGLTIGSKVIVSNGMNVFAPVADGSILRH
jgi:sugar O-acyltransferase (sialic acid O-acetyltransferase NeuD family)